MNITLSVIALIVIGIVIYAIILSRRKHISFLRALFLYRVSDLEFHYNHSNINNIRDRINSPRFYYLPGNIHNIHKH